MRAIGSVTFIPCTYKMTQTFLFFENFNISIIHFPCMLSVCRASIIIIVQLLNPTFCFFPFWTVILTSTDIRMAKYWCLFIEAQLLLSAVKCPHRVNNNSNNNIHVVWPCSASWLLLLAFCLQREVCLVRDNFVRDGDVPFETSKR